jgi:hypothetical protein
VNVDYDWKMCNIAAAVSTMTNSFFYANEALGYNELLHLLFILFANAD